jgi:glycosyltransferase involved in cell wall biosynthesis
VRHLHFTQSLEPLYGGGLATSTVALHRQLLSMGTPSTLCSTYGESPMHSAENTMEWRRCKPDFLYYAPQMKSEVKEVVSSAEVLHGHGFYVGTNYLFGREARRQKKALVYHVHGFFEEFILNRSRWKKTLVHWLFEDANFRHARLWRALTRKEEAQIRAVGIKAPIVVVPVGIHLTEFDAPHSTDTPIDTPFAPNLLKTRRRALFVSRLHPKKGLDLLVPAWAGLGSLTKDWELILAGPDEGGHAKQVEQWIQQNNVQDSVKWVGKVSQKSKIALLKSADLFILPSYSEGFTSAILEAMAASVPVLATVNCNFPELFQNDGGWECQANRESLSAVLSVALQASNEERLQRGRAARRLLERDYTWPQIAKRLLDACAAHCQ